MTNAFFKFLDEGAIHFRDNLQFELKSHFVYNPEILRNTFTQELFLFIPQALQINKETYRKEQFYHDETNLIRYKTPHYSFREILHPENIKSPLYRIHTLDADTPTNAQIDLIVEEMKLFGNIVRSALREEVYHLIKELAKDEKNAVDYQADIKSLCSHVKQIRAEFIEIQNKVKWLFEYEQLKQNFRYVDEFISNTIEYYLTGFLSHLRQKESINSPLIDTEIVDLIEQEQNYRQKHRLVPIKHEKSESTDEAKLYRSSLLQKYMLEALLLVSNRVSIQQQHGPFLGSLAAGVAMLVYMILFIFLWKNPQFVIGSIPFVLSVVFFYILKDRIKEGMKAYYHHMASRFFPDYRTIIYSHNGIPIGELVETFSFVEKQELPEEIIRIRSEDFHDDLEAMQRLETVIRYKKQVSLFDNPECGKLRRSELNIIFRYNIHRYLEKASDPTESLLVLDPKTKEIVEKALPKVYHLNIIIVNHHYGKDASPLREVKKFRVVIDKKGIKRVESIGKKKTAS